MADFLSRLSQRVLGSADMLQPSTPSLFAPGRFPVGLTDLDASSGGSTSIDRVDAGSRPSRPPVEPLVSPSPAIQHQEAGAAVRPTETIERSGPSRRVSATPAAPSSGVADGNHVQRRASSNPGSVSTAPGDAMAGTVTDRISVVPHSVDSPSVSSQGARGTGSVTPSGTAPTVGNPQATPDSRTGFRSIESPLLENSVHDEMDDAPLSAQPRLLVSVFPSGESPASGIPGNERESSNGDPNPVESSRADEPERGNIDVRPPLVATPRRETMISSPTGEQRSSHRNQTEAPAVPTIQVSIGRIDVRATYPAPTERHRPAPQQPSLTLDAYLRQQNGRRS